MYSTLVDISHQEGSACDCVSRVRSRIVAHLVECETPHRRATKQEFRGHDTFNRLIRGHPNQIVVVETLKHSLEVKSRSW